MYFTFTLIYFSTFCSWCCS